MTSNQTSTLNIYKRCTSRATSGLIRNWPLVLGSIVAFIALELALQIFSPLGMAGGFIVGFIQIFLLSLYYAWISGTVEKERIRIPDLYQIDMSLFFAILNVAFILFIVNFLLQGADWGLKLIISLAINVLLNAVPEVIYNHRSEGLDSIVYTANFVRTHWIEWFTPLLVVIAPLLFLLHSPKQALILFSVGEPLLPAVLVARQGDLFFSYGNIFGVLGVFVAILLANWYMIFRGYLFQELERKG